MKGSLATSTLLHAAVLGFALSSFTAPKTLEVEDVEAFPVNIVPIEELTQIQQGDKTAAPAETAAPVPTSRPERVPDAQNTGDNTVDLKRSEAATPSPREVISEAPPKPAEKPAPTPVPAPEVTESEPAPASEPTPQPEPAPAQPEAAPEEVAALPPEPSVDPVAEAITQAAPDEPQFAALPSAGPVPQARPAPPKAAAAQETASTKQSDFNADDVSALLNKQDAAGGGAKRSTETAALGGSRSTRGNTLSLSEMDALRGQIQRNWNIIPGMADGGDVRVTVTMRLDQAGNIIGQPDVSASGGSDSVRRTLAGSARRAVLKSQPFQLPAEKYDSWAEVIVNFDPSQMF
jgi:outer membrane biosynthesis protein TonB